MTASAPRSRSPSRPAATTPSASTWSPCSVNDLVVQGAEPLFFLDYYAYRQARAGNRRRRGRRHRRRLPRGRLRADRRRDRRNARALSGRRLRSRRLRGRRGRARRAAAARRYRAKATSIIGLASSGVHSNGYSLVRKVVAKSGLLWSAPAPFAPTQSLGEAILTPTRIYVKSCLAAIRATKAVKGLAHITGGGFPDNIPRVLPKGLGARIDLAHGAGAAGVQVAGARRRHRAERNAAHLQLRHRHDRRSPRRKDAAAVAQAFTQAGETAVHHRRAWCARPARRASSMTANSILAG